MATRAEPPSASDVDGGELRGAGEHDRGEARSATPPPRPLVAGVAPATSPNGMTPTSIGATALAPASDVLPHGRGRVHRCIMPSVTPARTMGSAAVPVALTRCPSTRCAPPRSSWPSRSCAGWLHLVCFFLAIPAGDPRDRHRRRRPGPLGRRGLRDRHGRPVRGERLLPPGPVVAGRPPPDAAARPRHDLRDDRRQLHAAVPRRPPGLGGPGRCSSPRGSGATVGIVLAFSGGRRSRIARGALYIALGWVSVGGHAAAHPPPQRRASSCSSPSAACSTRSGRSSSPPTGRTRSRGCSATTRCGTCSWWPRWSATSWPSRPGRAPRHRLALGPAPWRSSSTCSGARPDPAAGDALRDRLLGDDRRRRCSRGGARGLTRQRARRARRPRRRARRRRPEGEPTHVAQVSVWVDSYDRRGDLDDIVAVAPATPPARYLVTESLYDDYGTTPTPAPRTWPDGERSPGRAHRRPHPPSRGPRLRRVDRALARHPVARVRPAAAPHPLRAQRGACGRSRPARPRSTGSSRRGGRRPSTWPTRCCSSTPTATRSAAAANIDRDAAPTSRPASTWPASAAPR